MQGVVPSSTPLDLTVGFDGLGRLISQDGQLGGETVDRDYTYDGLSRLKTAEGPWEKATGAPGKVIWTYSYDALGNLRGQASTRSPANLADNRTWTYGHATKPHVLTSFAQQNQITESPLANIGGEVATILRAGSPPSSLTWNAQGKLHRYKDSTWSYDVFDQATLVVTGPVGSSTSIVSVGDDFEYDIGALRSNKFFSIQGVRIASLATSYTAPSASVPPALRIVVRFAAPLAAPAAAALLGLGFISLASLTLRRRTPVWLAAPGVGLLAFTLVALPYTAHAATLTSGPGAYGRHGEPILAYLVDHLGTIRGAVNQAGTVVETRDYAPFGEPIAHTGAFSVQHRFTGQPQDDQAGGLYDHGARFYNAKWGRFVSPDEMVQGFDSQGLNPFTYVLNQPSSLIDPDGAQAIDPNIPIGVPAHGEGASSEDPSVPAIKQLIQELKSARADLSKAEANESEAIDAGMEVVMEILENSFEGEDNAVNWILLEAIGLAGVDAGSEADRLRDKVDALETQLGGRVPPEGGPSTGPPRNPRHPSNRKRELQIEVAPEDASPASSFEPGPPPGSGIVVPFYVPFGSAFGPVW